MKSCYKIHDLFSFSIEGNKRVVKTFDNEYGYFKVSDIESPDLVVNVGKFSPKNLDGCHIINHKYFIRENYIYCKDSYKVAKWKVEIDDLDSKTTYVNFDGGPFSLMFLVMYVIEPIMRYKSIKNGHAFLHSSGISDGKDAVLFTACKGVGKTSTILNLINNGMIYLGDDFTGISKDGMVNSFPTTIHLYYYNARQCPFIFKKLSLPQKMHLKFNEYLYKIFFKYASLPLNVNVEEIFEKGSIGDTYPLSAVFYLDRTISGKPSIEKMDIDDLAKRVVAVNKFEAQHFLHYITAYSAVFPGSDPSKHWERVENNVKKILKDKKLFIVRIPTNYNNETFNLIKNKIRNESLLKHDFKEVRL